jgi:hypothetical protein
MNKIALAVLGTGLATLVANAQTNNPAANPAQGFTAPVTVAEPEWQSKPYLLSPTGVLLEVEQQHMTKSMNVKAMGFGGASQALVLNGAKSPVRTATMPEFIVKVSGDPSQLVTLYRLDIKKDQRVLVIEKSAGLVHGYSTTSNKRTVDLKFAKYGEASAKITPATPLEPGEYALDVVGAKVGFFFGVDSDSKE